MFTSKYRHPLIYNIIMKADEFCEIYRSVTDITAGRNHGQDSDILCSTNLRKKAVPTMRSESENVLQISNKAELKVSKSEPIPRPKFSFNVKGRANLERQRAINEWQN